MFAVEAEYSAQRPTWEFGPTARAYIHSPAQINALFGPPGSHKTFASIEALIVHQLRCGCNIRCGIIRDTLENIRISLVPSFYEYFKQDPTAVQFKNEYKELRINLKDGFHIDADLFGCNDPSDLQRLQGASSWDCIWINDPAPMTSRGNAGVPEWVYDHAAYRSTRRTGTPSRLQLDLNYAEELHWTFKRLVLEPDIVPEAPDIVKRVFYTNYDELPTVNEEARQMAARVFAHDPTAKARYVEGRFAEFQPGVRVTPGYRREIHLCPDPINPAVGLDCFAFCDGWFNPTCVLGQITTSRRLIYIDTVRTEGTDIGTLLETQVGPLLHTPKWKNKWRSWRIGGDITMKNRDQGKITHNAADEVEKFFAKFEGGFIKPTFEGGPRKWAARRDAGNHWLIQNDPRNRPMVYLSRLNHLLDKGLNGAWHYPVDNSGNPKSKLPFPDEISHVMEAWVNSVYVLLGGVPAQVSKKAMNRQSQLLRRRAESYGGGRVGVGSLSEAPPERPRKNVNQDRNRWV
jgi:hypothetical protein